MEDHHRRELELDEQIKAGQRRQIQRLQEELVIERGENLVRVEALQKAARAVEAELQAVKAEVERYKRDVEGVKNRARCRIAKREPPATSGVGPARTPKRLNRQNPVA